MVQKRPAKESAIRAPMREVKLDVAEKLVRMLEAGTRGMLRSCVKYVIMLAWNPELANLSHTSFPRMKGIVLIPPSFLFFFFFISSFSSFSLFFL